MNIKYLLLTCISGFVITLDQLTKSYIHTKFFIGQSKAIIPDYFNLTYVRNPGAAFGFLANIDPNFRDTFFLILPPVALVIILYILKSVSEKDKVQTLALSLVFGGAIGNYIDRLRIGAVIDFLDFHFKNQYSWPAFNIADSAIVVGISILLLISFRKEEKVENSESSTQEA